MKMMNNKGMEAANLWVVISIAVITILLLIMAIPDMFGQGFANIESKFCLGVDTDEDGVPDEIERIEGRCICNEDIPSQQFYVIDSRIRDRNDQTLFLHDNFPTRISFEDVTRISRYLYELEACDDAGGCTTTPTLTFKSDFGKHLAQTNPPLDDFCLETTGCTIEDFKEDFFTKESKYTYKTMCAIPNTDDACEALREQRCLEEKAKAENAEAQKEQA